MSYIIKGILGGKLPWALVLLGAMIAIVLEMSGIPSLAFAVGVYLPLSSSSPILLGGVVRWGVDKWIARKHEGKNLTGGPAHCRGRQERGRFDGFGVYSWRGNSRNHHRLPCWSAGHGRIQ